MKSLIVEQMKLFLQNLFIFDFENGIGTRLMPLFI